MIKGKLFIIGGVEDKGESKDKRRELNDDATVYGYYDHGILKRIVKESAHKEKSRIEILTTASTVPKEIGGDYKKAFARLNAENTVILDIESREQAHREDILTRLDAADVVMVTGGDQMRLTSLRGGTPFLSLLQEKYQSRSLSMRAVRPGLPRHPIIWCSRGPARKHCSRGKSG